MKKTANKEWQERRKESKRRRDSMSFEDALKKVIDQEEALAKEIDNVLKMFKNVSIG